MGVTVFRILVFLLVRMRNPAEMIDIIVGVVAASFAMPVKVLVGGSFVKVVWRWLSVRRGIRDKINSPASQWSNPLDVLK